MHGMFFFLQELGGFASVPKGDVKTEILSLSGESYHVIVYQAPLSHHCIAVLLRDKLALDIKNKHLFGAGLIYLSVVHRAGLCGLVRDIYPINNDRMWKRSGSLLSLK